MTKQEEREGAVGTPGSGGVPAVRLEGVTFSYDGEPVIESASLEVASGQFVTVVGPNGGGKTTLLRLILGLLRPTKGTVSVFGKPPQDSRARMGYVPQHSQMDPSFPVTVLDVVLMGRLGRTRALGRYSVADIEASRGALGEVGLGDLAERPFANLSGGQIQRTLIARALASDPELLLLDEPTANLDKTMEKELYEVILGLRERLTVILASHDLAFVSGFTDKVACVDRRVVMHPTSEVTPQLINRLYGRNVRFVRHDHLEGGSS